MILPTRAGLLGGAAALLALAVLPISAHAQRNASPSELRSLARAVDLPARCFTARISTVNGKWGKLLPSDTNAQACIAASGMVVLRRDAAGAWKARYQGPVEPSGSCEIARGHVPPSIRRDLRVCGIG